VTRILTDCSTELPLKKEENLLDIICKLQNPLMSSLHDAILSSWNGTQALDNVTSEPSCSAPRIRNNRVKTFWSDEGIVSYQRMLEPQLHHLQ